MLSPFWERQQQFRWIGSGSVRFSSESRSCIHINRSFAPSLTLALARRARWGGNSLRPIACDGASFRILLTRPLPALKMASRARFCAREAIFVLARGHTTPFADVKVGHYSSNPGHLLNIAWKTGRQIRWDGSNEQVLDHPEPNAMVTKEYRKPWALEV